MKIGYNKFLGKYLNFRVSNCSADLGCDENRLFALFWDQGNYIEHIYNVKNYSCDALLRLSLILPKCY